MQHLRSALVSTSRVVFVGVEDDANSLRQAVEAFRPRCEVHALAGIPEVDHQRSYQRDALADRAINQRVLSRVGDVDAVDLGVVDV